MASWNRFCGTLISKVSSSHETCHHRRRRHFIRITCSRHVTLVQYEKRQIMHSNTQQANLCTFITSWFPSFFLYRHINTQPYYVEAEE